MKQKLKADLKNAMKAQDRLRLDTIRAVLSEIQYEEMQKSINELPEQDCVTVVQREVKKRQEAIQFADQANRPEAKQQLLSEIAVLESFLPKQLSSDELERMIVEMKSSNTALTLPLVMKHLKENFAGKYDGKLASEAAKRVLG
jgi:uncharacterized protein YqeY